MKKKLVLISVPVGCEFCCEDCNIESCQSGMVVKGEVTRVVTLGQVDKAIDLSPMEDSSLYALPYRKHKEAIK